MISREEDARQYLVLYPDGEAKTVWARNSKGRLRKFWRCRPTKGQGSWQALPNYGEIQ